MKFSKFLTCSIILLSFFLCNNSFSKIIKYTTDDKGVNFQLDKGSMQIEIINDVAVRIKYTILPVMPVKHSLVVINTSTAKFEVQQNENNIIIKTKKIIVQVNKQTEAITYFDANKNIILAEDGMNGKSMKPQTVAGIETYSCKTQFLSATDEALYGLGCHPEDTLSINYKGRKQDMAIKYMTGAIPVLLSTKGYGLLFDNYAASNFNGTVDNNTKYEYESESGKMIDYYFFYGPDFDKIISSYRKITGHAPMFPKWAFGLFQSEDRYKSQAEVLKVKDNYRNNHIPVDCIVQDWFYWEPNVIGSHIMYPERYPNPKQMVDELHKANIHAMISIWPVFAEGTNNFNALKKTGGLTSITWDNVMTHTFDSYYDAHSAAARDLYWKQAKDSLIAKYGWDAWWVDQCEPDNGALLDERKKADFAIGKGIDYFNTYSLMHSTGLYEHWRKDIPNKRIFLLIRQAFAGQQRNAATLWSSDITCTWKAFRSQVPQGINACTSGIPYWTSDIGGYHLNWQAPDWSTADNRELFTRWFQFGTFCPIFRIHGKGERALYSKNWDEDTRSILLKYDNLRYCLMPYIYSLAGKVTHNDYTIMRSLAFDFRNDKNIISIPDEYMFGSSILVSPVTNPKATTKNIYLPATTGWYDFYTGKYYNGGQQILADAPLEKIPLFVREGSIIPFGQALQYATEKPADTITLYVYTGKNAAFTLYEDENNNYNYEQGKYADIPFTYNEQTKILTIEKRKGSFEGMLKERIFRIVWIDKNKNIGYDDMGKNADFIVKYDGNKISVPNK